MASKSGEHKDRSCESKSRDMSICSSLRCLETERVMVMNHILYIDLKYIIYIYIIHIWSCVHVDIISGVLVIVFGALVPCHWRQHPAVRTRADPLPWPLHLPWSFYPLCRHRCGRRSSEEMVLPLGYQTTGAYFDGNSYGKSPPLLGKSTINGPFSIAIMLVYQRVNRWILLSNTAIYCWFTH